MTEGRLIKRLLTRGGRWWPVGGAGDAAPIIPAGGPSRLVPAREPRVAGPRDGGAGNRSKVRRTRPGPTAVDRRPSNSRGEAGRLKREVHRGRDGANLKTPRAGRLGLGGLAVLSDFDKPRCREASRSAGPLGPLASRAPSVLLGAAESGRRPARGRKEYGRRSVG